MNELEKLEESTGKATGALLMLSKVTDDFASAEGIEIVSVSSLKTVFGEVLQAIQDAQNARAKRKKGKVPTKAPIHTANVAPTPKAAAKIAEPEEEVNEETGEVTTKAAAPKTPVTKNKGGRPKGSANKPKAAAQESLPIPAPAVESNGKAGDSDPVWD